MANVTIQRGIVLKGLEVCRRVAEETGECVPSLFVVRAGEPDWDHPFALENPADHARVAERAGAGGVVVIGSHLLYDPDDAVTELLKLYSGLLNARGEVLLAAKQQKWDDDAGWSEPSILQGPLPVSTFGWRV